MRPILSPEEEKYEIQGIGWTRQLQLLNPHVVPTRQLDLCTVKHSPYRRHRVLNEEYKESDGKGYMIGN